MRIAVVGAGVFGLAAAIEAAARGHRVSVFEQGEIPHPAASSTDVSKGMRRMWYASDNETYVELAERAAVQWRAWEELAGDRFYHQVGSLRAVADFTSGSPMRASADFLLDRGAEIVVLSAQEAGQRFPQLRFAADEVCVYDPWPATSRAPAIGVMAGLARDHGCRVYPSTAVTSVEERVSDVAIAYRAGRDRFDCVVVAAGSWVGRLLPAVGAKVRVTRQQMLLIEPPDPRAFSGDVLPVWMIDHDGEGWYGFPLLRGGYAKVPGIGSAKRSIPTSTAPAPRRSPATPSTSYANGFRGWPPVWSSRAAPACTPTRPTTTSWWTGCRARSGSSSPAAAAATASSSAARSAR